MATRIGVSSGTARLFAWSYGARWEMLSLSGRFLLSLCLSAFSYAVACGQATPIDIGGGPTGVPFGQLGTDMYGLDTGKVDGSGNQIVIAKDFISFHGRNTTGQLIKDFTFKLTNCGTFKFRWIKVFPRIDPSAEDPVDAKSDWDVDDDMDGHAAQGMVPDMASERMGTGADGKAYATHLSNETDNIHHSP